MWEVRSGKWDWTLTKTLKPHTFHRTNVTVWHLFEVMTFAQDIQTFTFTPKRHHHTTQICLFHQTSNKWWAESDGRAEGEEVSTTGNRSGNGIGNGNGHGLGHLRWICALWAIVSNCTRSPHITQRYNASVYSFQAQSQVNGENELMNNMVYCRVVGFDCCLGCLCCLCCLCTIWHVVKLCCWHMTTPTIQTLLTKQTHTYTHTHPRISLTHTSTSITFQCFLNLSKRQKKKINRKI